MANIFWGFFNRKKGGKKNETHAHRTLPSHARACCGIRLTPYGYVLNLQLWENPVSFRAKRMWHQINIGDCHQFDLTLFVDGLIAVNKLKMGQYRYICASLVITDSFHHVLLNHECVSVNSHAQYQKAGMIQVHVISESWFISFFYICFSFYDNKVSATRINIHVPISRGKCLMVLWKCAYL